MPRKFALLLLGLASCFAQAPLVANVGNFIHSVGDVDRSLRFYRDVIGMDAPRPAGDWQTGEGVLNLYDAAGAKFRVANAQVTGSPMRVELAEFKGVHQFGIFRPWRAAGSSLLMLTVADLTPIEERVKADKVRVLVKTKKACDGRGMIIDDPDAFPVMLVERSARPPEPSKSNVTGLRFGYFVSSDAIARGPFAALGLRTATRTHICQPIEEALVSDGPSIVTFTSGFEIWLFNGKKQKSHPRFSPHDVGAAVLRLAVTNVDSAVQALRQAEVNVVSAGGAIQTLPPAGLRAAILGAPDDLFIQVIK